MPKNRPQPPRRPNQRPSSGPGSRSPRPDGRRRPGQNPPPTGWRASLERVSYPALVRLTQAPKWLLGLVTAGVLLGGLLAPAPWSPVLLSIVVLFLTWLMVLAWPRLEPTARVIRAAVIIALAAMVVARATGAL